MDFHLFRYNKGAEKLYIYSNINVSIVECLRSVCQKLLEGTTCRTELFIFTFMALLETGLRWCVLDLSYSENPWHYNQLCNKNRTAAQQYGVCAVHTHVQ